MLPSSPKQINEDTNNGEILASKPVSRKKNSRRAAYRPFNVQIGLAFQPAERMDTSKLTECLAIDCEMVGTARSGNVLLLGRVSIVNDRCETVLDVYVYPTRRVTNYHTAISGLTKELVENGVDFKTISENLYEQLDGHTLVGHTLSSDFSVLWPNKGPPPNMTIRDLTKYNGFKTMLGVTRRGPIGLRELSTKLLDVQIQDGTHCSVEDARATMRLFNLVKHEWNHALNEDAMNTMNS